MSKRKKEKTHLIGQLSYLKGQPRDQSVIRSLKIHYRSRLLCLLAHKEPTQVTLYKGLSLAQASWKINVQEETIVKCWEHSGLVKFNETDVSGSKVRSPQKVRFSKIYLAISVENVQNQITMYSMYKED